MSRCVAAAPAIAAVERQPITVAHAAVTVHVALGLGAADNGVAACTRRSRRPDLSLCMCTRTPRSVCRGTCRRTEPAWRSCLACCSPGAPFGGVGAGREPARRRDWPPRVACARAARAHAARPARRVAASRAPPAPRAVRCGDGASGAQPCVFPPAIDTTVLCALALDSVLLPGLVAEGHAAAPHAIILRGAAGFLDLGHECGGARAGRPYARRRRS